MLWADVENPPSSLSLLVVICTFLKVIPTHLAPVTAASVELASYPGPLFRGAVGGPGYEASVERANEVRG